MPTKKNIKPKKETVSTEECKQLKENLDNTKTNTDFLVSALNKNVDAVKNTEQLLIEYRKYLSEIGISPNDVNQRIQEFSELTKKVVNEHKYNILAIESKTKKKIGAIEQEMKDKKCESE